MEIRVLVALEDEYRAYREVLAAGFRILRPDVKVATTVPSDVEAERGRFDPQVVICSRAGAADTRDPTTWVDLSLDPSQPTVVRLGGRRFEHSNPTFDALLEIVDEAGRQAEAKKGDGPNESATGGAATGSDVPAG